MIWLANFSIYCRSRVIGPAATSAINRQPALIKLPSRRPVRREKCLPPNTVVLGEVKTTATFSYRFFGKRALSFFDVVISAGVSLQCYYRPQKRKRIMQTRPSRLTTRIRYVS